MNVLRGAFLASLFPTAIVVAFGAPSSTQHQHVALTMAAEEATTAAAPQLTKKKMFDEFLDEEKMLAEQTTFPIKADALMERAKYVLGPECGIGTMDDAECLADDFEFIAAVVGPIPRNAYLDALSNFNLADSFDITSNYFGMHVDPLQPNRVWFMNRVRGIHTGDFMGAKPTNKEIVYPPQTLHLDFNDEGKVTEFGFYTSDRRQGNTGGLGGAFGFMYGVGKPLPIPECQPYKPSKRFRFLQFMGRIGEKLQKSKK